jgi:hypothetical protein
MGVDVNCSIVLSLSHPFHRTYDPVFDIVTTTWRWKTQIDGYNPDSADPSSPSFTTVDTLRVFFYGAANYSLDWNIYLAIKSLATLFQLDKSCLLQLMVLILAANLVASGTLLVVFPDSSVSRLSFLGFEVLFTIVFLFMERTVNNAVSEYKRIAGDRLKLDGVKRQLLSMIGCNVTTIAVLIMDLVYFELGTGSEWRLHLFQIAFGADVIANLLFHYFTFNR